MEIARVIFSKNIDEIRNTIESSFVNSIPSEHMEFKIKINLISLCNDYPLLINQMSKDFLPCKEAIIDLIKEEIKSMFTNENIEYTQLVNFQELFDILLVMLNIPIPALESQINKTHELLLPKYSMKQINTNLFSNEPILEIVSNVNIPLCTFKGSLTEKSINIITKSSFYLCVNKNCYDKTYLLNLKNVSYNFKDSKKTFIFNSGTIISTCFNCKTQLEELIKRKKVKRTYNFILSDAKNHLICESELNLAFNENDSSFIWKCFYVTGYLFRRDKGQIAFFIFTSYQIEKQDEIDFKIAYVDLKTKEKLMNDLIYLTGIYFYDFKMLCSEEDVLLFIIINILNLSDKKILILTYDPVYAYRCCQNILKNEKKICYDPKSLCNSNSFGICVRAYNEQINKKIKFDCTFNITISSLLDYKYAEPDNLVSKVKIESSIKQIITSQIYSSQAENSLSNYEFIQMLFLNFREYYKGQIEPERLLDTLLLLYKSIENIMQGEKEEQYTKFIMSHFKGKII